MQTVFIGIAGGTGSGKSTFTNRLKDVFANDIAILYHDNYYRNHDDIPFAERVTMNYDHPDAFETDLLIEHLESLKRGIAIESPTYDYARHTRAQATIPIAPKRIVLVEGILALQDARLRDLYDIKIFVEADADERILRRIIRDVKERGRDVEGIARQYLTTVKPMHYEFVEPTKHLADIVINSGLNAVAFDIVRTKIASVLEQV